MSSWYSRILFVPCRRNRPVTNGFSTPICSTAFFARILLDADIVLPVFFVDWWWRDFTPPVNLYCYPLPALSVEVVDMWTVVVVMTRHVFPDQVPAGFAWLCVWILVPVHRITVAFKYDLPKDSTAGSISSPYGSTTMLPVSAATFAACSTCLRCTSSSFHLPMCL